MDKVIEDRYGKVKDRQVRKFNILTNKNKNRNNNNYNSSGNNSNLMQVEDTARVDSNNSNSNSQLQENNNRWVINLSKISLTEGQRSVLAKGPNFSIVPRHIPNVDYITDVESMHPKLKEEDAMELRANINCLVRKAQVPKPI